MKQTNQQKCDAIDAIMKQSFKDDAPGAAVIAIKEGKVLFEGAYGLANLELDVKNTPKTVFKIASITKQFTATAVLMLVNEGKITLQDSITQHVPYYPCQQTITIE
jgi:D-alanyl-D-alanine carboxypeptidase